MSTMYKDYERQQPCSQGIYNRVGDTDIYTKLCKSLLNKALRKGSCRLVVEELQGSRCSRWGPTMTVSLKQERERL